MIDSSVSRSGYSNKRSPGAFAAAAALNGGAIALLVAIPMSFVALPPSPPITVRWVPLDVPPPPNIDEPRPKPDKQEVRPATDQPARPDPTIVDPIMDLTRNPTFIGPITPPAIPAGNEVAATIEPPSPVLVRAKPDPRYAQAFRPDYPPAMRRDGLEGDVTVRVTIDARGRVVAVDLVAASNPIFFEETRRQALRSWRFVPATRDGVAIESVQTLTVKFRLEE